MITEAKEFPLANAWRGREMRVGTVVYQWIKERRQTVSFLFTYNTDQAWAWPEMGLVQEVLRDETLIPFHVVLDVSYSETAHLADLLLPWTTWMERWDIDSRPPLGLINYVGLCQPVVEPLGESKDIREILPELARRVGGGMEQYFPWKTAEEYLEAYFKPVPGGLAYMRQHGVWIDPQKAPNYKPYERVLTAAELEGSTTDPATGIIYKGEDPATKEPRPIGIMIQGVARHGFNTPSRKVEVDNQFVVDKGQAVAKRIEPMPVYDPIPDHQRLLEADQLIMISFKWNVHNAHRLTEGVHPEVIAISHNHGRWVGGPLPPATASGRPNLFPALGRHRHVPSGSRGGRTS